MTLSKNFFILFCLLFSLDSFSKKSIRRMKANDKKIQTVYLALGRSTILKFSEAPVNVVIGNKNYYNIEYINNDITIQPIGAVDTNLFVYTKSKRTYSFLLKVVGHKKYDDIVHIRWLSPYRNHQFLKRTKSRPEVAFNPINIEIKEKLKINVFELVPLIENKSYVIKLKIRNVSKRKIIPSKIKIFLTRSNRKLKYQQLLFKKDVILPGKSTEARVFLKLMEHKGFSLNISFQKKSTKKIISRKYL